MAIEVDIEIRNAEIVKKLDEVKKSLGEVSDASEKVSDSNRKAFSDTSGQEASIKAYEKIGVAIDKLKLKLQKLKRDQATAIGSIVPDVESIKKFNTEIAKTTGEIDKLQSKLDEGSGISSIGDQIKDSFSPANKKSIDNVSESLEGLVKPIDEANNSAGELGKITDGVLSDGLDAVSDGAGAAGSSVKKLTRLLTKNVYLAVAAAIAFLVAKLVDWAIAANKLQRFQQNLIDATNAANDSVVSQRVETEKLVDSLEANTTSLEDKEKALKRLQQLSPEYFGNLTIENGQVKGLTGSYQAYIIALKEVAKAKFLATKSIEIENEIASINLALDNLDSGSFQNRLAFISNAYQKFSLTKLRDKAVSELQIVNEAIKKEIEDNAISGPLLEDGSFNGTRVLVLTPEQIKAASLAERERQRLIIEAMKEGVDKQIALEVFRFEDLESKLESANISTEDAFQEHQNRLLEIKAKFVKDIVGSDLDAATKAKAIYENTLVDINAFEQSLRDNQDGNVNDDQIIQIFLMRRDAAKGYQDELERIRDKDLSLGKAYFKEQEQIEINLIKLAEGDELLDTEKEKQEAILNVKKQSLINQLELLKQGNELNKLEVTNIEVAIKDIENSISNLGGEIKPFTIEGGIAGLLGIDPDDPDRGRAEDAIREIGQNLTSIFSDLNAARIEAIQESIDLLDDELDATRNNIDSKQELLDREIELQEEGKANKADILRGELSDLKANESSILAEKKKAFEERKKAQKAQILLDSASQLSGLSTATVEIFKSVAGIPFVGVPLAIGLVASMFGAFAASKARALQSINRQKFKHGGSGKLIGASHEQDGIPFDGNKEAEGGEYFNVFSRSKTNQLGDKRLKGLYDFANNSSSMEIDRLLNNTGVILSPDLPNKLIRGQEVIEQRRITNMYNNNFTTLESDVSDIKKYLNKPTKSQTLLPDGRMLIKNGIKTKIIGKKILY